MKILLAADIFPPQFGGPATYVVNLANALTEKGNEVKIVTHNSNADIGVVKCKVYRVWAQNKMVRYTSYLALLFRHALGMDIIYAMGPVNAGRPASLVAKFLKKKFVVKVVGDYAWEQGVQRFGVTDSIDYFQKINSYTDKVKDLREKERKVVQQADKVIVPSMYLKEIVKGWGAKEKNIEVIYSEVRFDLAEPIKHEGEKWLVSVGRLVPWKGMDTLIDVIGEIAKENPDSGWKLKIVGDGPEMGYLKNKVKDKKVENIVELTGNLPKNEALKYMASADVFILNSSYEGFSHTLIEAMNQGAIPLASKVGGNVEVSDGIALFEYNNKQEIKEKVLKFSEMEKKGSRKEHKFHTDMIPDTIRVLKEVAGL